MENFDLEKYKKWLLSENPINRDVAVLFFFHCGIIDENIDNNLIRLLKTDDNLEIRRTIIHMFGDRVDKKFESSLFEALNDDDYVVRGNAYIGLIKLGVDKNNELLVKYRNHAIHDFERFCINDSYTK
jgi:HEAT repeat protein